MCEPEGKIQAMGPMFSHIPCQAGDTGEVRVTADGVHLDLQDTVRSEFTKPSFKIAFPYIFCISLCLILKACCQ